MKLPEVVERLRSEVPRNADWVVAILTRRDRDGSESDDILEYPIFEVSVDHDDQEINLICDQGAENPRSPTRALRLGDLLKQLEDLLSSCKTYSVYSGGALVEIDDEWESRYDAPLVGVARNQEQKIYGFLQHPPEQWGATP